MSDATDRLQSLDELRAILSNLGGAVGEVALTHRIAEEAGLPPEDKVTPKRLLHKFAQEIQTKYRSPRQLETLLAVYDNMLLEPGDHHKDVPELIFNEFLEKAREYKKAAAKHADASKNGMSI